MAARSRRGFALLMLLGIIVTILLVAVAGVASVAIVADHERVDRAAKILARITDSSRYSVVRFQQDVGEYPGKLSHLRFALVSGDKDICGNAYSTAERDEWG